MKLPAKIEYAYKAVLELAIQYNGTNPVQINTISQAQGVPKKFLVQLLLRLKSANIVNSSRGLAGGYYLTRPPSRISLADIFKAIDDTMISAHEKRKQRKVLDSDALLLRIWTDINEETARRLQEVTFDKLVAQVKGQELIYQI